ncbi:MAG: hypothetical protein Ct9H300mP18_14570 [Candidatus Neomarinimicrobiota bacterium]|nr:MAG: hypothetical protein Ct9H300mP18_14570 [Candidatus Neomarinimicrobiota bacterium]
MESIIKRIRSELRKHLDEGTGIPDWFTYQEVAKELQKSRPPKAERGFTIFFTGLSGSGKIYTCKRFIDQTIRKWKSTCNIIGWRYS